LREIVTATLTCAVPASRSNDALYHLHSRIIDPRDPPVLLIVGNGMRLLRARCVICEVTDFLLIRTSRNYLGAIGASAFNVFVPYSEKKEMPSHWLSAVWTGDDPTVKH
jgi:hypothetical protein